ncbi:septum site-determining protein Ssd [Rhodococcus sp. NPDC127528]|uniref:septum site-determining protein Ssd n=1 Tax=unclassified Rhodococcus (in: high G+C Gram-positive bacteria) TaxID=192944 RepID=UPI0036405B32
MDATHATPDRQVVAVTKDLELAVSIRRAAAAADRPLSEHAVAIPRRVWDVAAHLLLDADCAHECATAGLPRRAAVQLVCVGAPGLSEWRAAAAVGAETVLTLPDDEAVLVAALARVRDRPAGGGSVIAVVGGRGGAGASTLAAATALTAAARRGRGGLLVDCDPRGGGLDLLLGVEQTPGLRWPAVVIEGGAVSASALHDALPRTDDGVAVLSCGRGAGATAPGAAALRAVVEAGRGTGDVVVCDLPRQSAPATESVLDQADLVVVVVPAQLRAAAAAEALVAAVRGSNPNVGVVVRGPAPGGLRAADIADLLGLPLLAAMRPEPGLAGALEHGGLRLRRRSPLAGAAATVLDALGVGAARRAP